MIPKIIHYFWFGNKRIPKIANKCIKSWQEILPDYCIMFWNENNCDINSNYYVQEAYRNKKYAHVSDYFRLEKLYNYGGVYMDIDELVLRDFTPLLKDRDLVACFENNNYVMVGFLAAKPKSDLIYEFLNYYKNWKFNISTNFVNNPVIFTDILEKKGLIRNGKTQIIKNTNIEILSNDYLCCYDFNTNTENITDNTYAIQKYEGSWTSPYLKFKKIIKHIIVMSFGKSFLLDLKCIKKKLLPNNN